MKFKTVVYICQGHADMIYAFDEKIMIHRKIAKDWFKC